MEGNAALISKSNDLIQQLETLEQTLREPIADIKAKCDRLFEESVKLAQAWSGSYFGYHSELYYGDFERPPLGRRFNPEWGGIYGIPPGWSQRQHDEVKQQIEHSAQCTFVEVESKSKEMTGQARDLGSQMLVDLSPIHQMEGMGNEQKLLGEVEIFKWEIKATVYAHEHTPGTFMSRDSVAVAEGPRIPPHLFYEAEAHESLSRCTFLADFFRLGRRCLGQVRAQLEHHSIEEVVSSSASVDLALRICKRFHLAVKQLKDRYANRRTLDVNDEYDAQDLLHSVLRVHFDDIRREEWTPSYAGSTSRMDFLLKAEQIVIEVKMTRQGRGNKEIGNELSIDVVKYRSHHDCQTLICLVYDPIGEVKNPLGFERDFGQLTDDRLRVLAVISP